jgi:dsRNA-specific ribonuclease
MLAKAGTKQHKDHYKELSRAQLAKVIKEALEKEKQGLISFPEFNAQYDSKQEESQGYQFLKLFLHACLLDNANVEETVIVQDKLTDKLAMTIFRRAFRHPTVNSDNNQGPFVVLGLETFEKVLDDYISSKHPSLFFDQGASIKCSQAVKAFKERIDFYHQFFVNVPTHGLVNIEQLIHYKEVSYTIKTYDSEIHRTIKKNESMVRDTFFAVIGAIEYIINTLTLPNVGFFAVRSILFKILDTLQVPIEPELTMSDYQKIVKLSIHFQDLLSFSWRTFANDKNNPMMTTQMSAMLVFKGNKKVFYSDSALDGNEVLGKLQLAAQMLKYLDETYGIKYTYTIPVKENANPLRAPSMNVFFQDKTKLSKCIDHIIRLINTRGKFKVSKEELIDSEAITMIQRAFRHRSVDNLFNYEVIETLGDKTYNKIVTQYVIRKFVKIFNDKDSLKKLLEVGKRYHGKEEAPEMSKMLGIIPYLMVEKSEFTDKKLYTDLLESFIWLVEWLVDRKFGQPVGYHVISNILDSMLKTFDITIDLAKLIPRAQQIKEIFDSMKAVLTQKENEVLVVIKYPTKYTEGKLDVFPTTVTFRDVEEAYTWANRKFGVEWSPEGIIVK